MEKVKIVLLVGTNHSYQHPGNPGSCEFRKLVTDTCTTRDIKAIGEEMSLDVLKKFKSKQSVCKQVADCLSIPHRYCDPSIEKQKSLGIKNPCKSRVSDSSCDPDIYKKDPEVGYSFKIREGHWLKHLLKLDTWPVLFVCGCNHTKSFPALLRGNGIVVRMLYTAWKPTC